jgi:predicted transcriptional regulator
MSESTFKEPGAEILGASIPTSLATTVRALAERDDRSISWEIREALRRYVAEREDAR